MTFNRKTFCDTQPPEGIVLETNELMLRYKRKTLTQSGCSGGFVCALYTVGGESLRVVRQENLFLTPGVKYCGKKQQIKIFC